MTLPAIAPGDADAHEHRAVLGAAHRSARDAAERMRPVAERVEEARDGRQPASRRASHATRAQRAADVELGAHHAGSSSGTRSTSHTHEAQCTPSR